MPSTHAQEMAAEENEGGEVTESAMVSQKSSPDKLIRMNYTLNILLLVVMAVVGCTAQPRSVGVTSTPTYLATDVRVTETMIPPTETLSPLPTVTLDARVAEIEALMTTYEQMDLFSGAVLVAERGEVIYKKAIGYANREWLIPNTLDTRFRVASLSKQFTKILVLQLVEEGKLSLDGTIALYLPDYTGPGADQITIDFLLKH